VDPTTRRPATPEEAKALGHPLRQRIIRLCGTEERTNKQLAERLGRDPATVLHHVRQLVATGFLEPCEERPTPSGAVEKPYRSTGRSWTIDLGTDPNPASAAMLDATRDELLAAGQDAVVTSARLVVRLPDDELEALAAKVSELVEEAHERSGPLDDRSLPAYGTLFLVHRLPDDEPGP
jgi:predicted ArsR family transcriptional regulator